MAMHKAAAPHVLFRVRAKLSSATGRGKMAPRSRGAGVMEQAGVGSEAGAQRHATAYP